MQLKVVPIQAGTVIDHIPPGRGRIVYRLLSEKIGSQPTVVLLNAPSTTRGKKDIVKMENVFITKDDIDIIALVAPEATINVINGGKVTEKYAVKMPQRIDGILKCLNPKCVTNAEREPLATRFVVTNSPLKLRCEYCDKEYDDSLVSKDLV